MNNGTSMTLDELKDRIRGLKSMQDVKDLRREIGPSDEETRMQEQRLAHIDAITEKCLFGEMYPGAEALRARQTHARLLRQCMEEFESIYL